ncbi:MAG: flagellar filament capping protein FliD [Clostridium sp.]
MVMRIGGLASGIDTDSTVKQMLMKEQERVDKVKGEKQILQWKQETYRDLIGGVNSIKSKYFDILNKGTYALSNDFFSSLSASIVGTDKGLVNIKTNNDAKPGRYAVTITQKATGAKAEGEIKTDKNNNKVTLTTKVSDIGAIGDGNLKVKIGSGADVAIPVTGTTTINGLVTSINSNPDLKGKVIASFSEISGKFSIETVATGKNETLTISGGIATALKILPINSGEGKDAEIQVTLPDGSTGKVTSSKNNFTKDGINFDIKGSDPTENIFFNIGSDVNKTVDNIKGLVKAYNELIDSVTSKIYEKKQYKLAPLTEEQKKDMSETDIKNWEERCKEGIIKSDPALEKMLSDMRGAFFKSVEGVNISLKDIGIDTTDYRQRGKLEINEEKLRQALAEKPGDVAALFSKDNTSKPYDKDKGYSGNEDRNKSIGIFTRISDVIEDAIRTGANKNGIKGSLIEKAGIKGGISDSKNSITKSIQEKDKIISDLLTKMKDKEARLYAKFSRLETMMNKFNSQSSWLTQQLGGM